MLIQNQEFDLCHGGHQKRHGLTLAAGKDPHFYIQLILQPKPQRLKLFPVKINSFFVCAPPQIKGPAFVIRQ